jgi:hypothetical protein
VRNRLAWVLAGLGVAAGLRALRRRRASAAVAEPAPLPDARADELRRKLEESRAIVEEREAFEDGETPVDQAEPVTASSPEDRRREVHERAQTSVESMRRSSPQD